MAFVAEWLLLVVVVIMIVVVVINSRTDLGAILRLKGCDCVQLMMIS